MLPQRSTLRSISVALKCARPRRGRQTVIDKGTLRTPDDKDLFTEHDRRHVIRRTHVTNSVSESQANRQTDGYAAPSAVQQPLLASFYRATICVTANDLNAVGSFIGST
ncbi:uncharacterized protein LOC143353666 [Halictus rubicundus]|uniref:uncharacterized protein LOC143353666 n=1 Tax=Halictus rubicundus TaxID=77578 RepID=UPI0040352DEA